MSAPTADFTKLEPSQVNFNNTLLSQELSLSIEAEAGKLIFNNLRRVNVLPDEVFALSYKFSDHNWQCFITITDAEKLLKPYFNQIDLRALPELLMEAALEKTLAAFQATIKDQFGAWLELTQVKLGKGSRFIDDSRVLVTFDLSFGALSLPVYVYLLQEQVTLLLDRYSVLAKKDELKLFLPAVLSFGYTSLAQQEVQALVPGDVIFFDACYYKNESQLYLNIAKHCAWQVQLNQGTVTLIKPWSQKMEQQTVADLSSEEQALNLDQINMKVSFEMQPHNMPLSDIKAMKTGYVFDLQADPSNAIYLKVNGQTLGLGELVSIGGKLGVRLTSLEKG